MDSHQQTVGSNVLVLLVAEVGSQLNAVSMLCQHRRCWPSIETALGQRPLLCGDDNAGWAGIFMSPVPGQVDPYSPVSQPQIAHWPDIINKFARLNPESCAGPMWIYDVTWRIRKVTRCVGKNREENILGREVPEGPGTSCPERLQRDLEHHSQKGPKGTWEIS